MLQFMNNKINGCEMNMKVKRAFAVAVGFGVLLVILVGCSATPASQVAEESAAPQASQQVAEESIAPQATQQASAAQMQHSEAADSQVIEVGYKVGMQAPDFEMTLLDGSKVTSASIANEGEPVLIFFHATW